MKYISLFLLIFVTTINYNKLFAEDALTIKQQLDRIMEEVKDLNKAVFNKSFDNEELNSLDENIDTERFTSIDIRIYDLEKDIKNLTLQFEEILFKLDDISNDMIGLESEFISKLEKINIIPKETIENNKAKSEDDLEIKEENTLGKILISNNNNNENNNNNIQNSKNNNNTDLRFHASETLGKPEDLNSYWKQS